MRYRIQRHNSGGYVGAIELPFRDRPAFVSAVAVGDTKADAIAKAAQVAERIASDPVIRALVPPQARAAIAVTKGLASAARRGLPTLRRVWGSLSPKSKALAKELATEVQQGKIGEVGWNPFRRKKKKKKKKNREELDKGSDNEGDDEGDDEGAEE